MIDCPLLPFIIIINIIITINIIIIIIIINESAIRMECCQTPTEFQYFVKPAHMPATRYLLISFKHIFNFFDTIGKL